ncbi:hypothetical protein ScPMuIL_012630 [Solemya velum]
MLRGEFLHLCIFICCFIQCSDGAITTTESATTVSAATTTNIPQTTQKAGFSSLTSNVFAASKQEKRVEQQTSEDEVGNPLLYFASGFIVALVATIIAVIILSKYRKRKVVTLNPEQPHMDPKSHHPGNSYENCPVSPSPGISNDGVPRDIADGVQVKLNSVGVVNPSRGQPASEKRSSFSVARQFKALTTSRKTKSLGPARPVADQITDTTVKVHTIARCHAGYDTLCFFGEHEKDRKRAIWNEWSAYDHIDLKNTRKLNSH